MLQQTIPISEIWLWRAYFDTEYERHEKADWYMAQIAMAIDRAHSTKKRVWHVRDYLLRFRRPTKIMKPSEAKNRIVSWLKGLSSVAEETKHKRKPK